MANDKQAYPIVIIEAGADYVAEVMRLEPVATLIEAIAATRHEGYTVLAHTSETSDTWELNGPMYHLVIVLPR